MRFGQSSPLISVLQRTGPSFCLMPESLSSINTPFGDNCHKEFEKTPLQTGILICQRDKPPLRPRFGVKPLPALPAAPRPAGSGCARLCPSSSALPPFPLPPPPPSPPAGRCPRRDGGHRGAGDPALHLLPLPTALPPLLPAGECRRGLRLALPLPLTACPSLLPFPPPHRGGRSPAGAEGGRRRRAGRPGGPSGAVSPPSPPAAPAILGSARSRVRLRLMAPSPPPLQGIEPRPFRGILPASTPLFGVDLQQGTP